MVTIRLMGLEKDIKKAIKKLEKTFEIISVSEPYPNRNSKRSACVCKNTKLIKWSLVFIFESGYITYNRL
jgi:hypothetical protein